MVQAYCITSVLIHLSNSYLHFKSYTHHLQLVQSSCFFLKLPFAITPLLFTAALSAMDGFLFKLEQHSTIYT